MRVAVVIPCFNDGRFLPDALASLADQEPHELVIVDDGSEDAETLALLDSLRAAGTTVVSQANAGLGPARMAGVAATTAPYVHPLDADDRLAPGALRTLADALDANPQAAAAWGDYRTFGVSDCHFPTAPRLDPWRITFLDEIPGTTMVRREAIEAVGGWDAVGYEDWDFWMRLAEHGFDGVGVGELTLLYREHETPRLLADTVAEHDRRFGTLRTRHARLFAARRRNWSASQTPLMLKLALPLIDAVPGLSEARKRKLWGMARYFFQREMCSECYRSPFTRLRELVLRREAPEPPIDALDA
jgi:glycosyltransferase involved in cell wall biosynthesis